MVSVVVGRFEKNCLISVLPVCAFEVPTLVSSQASLSNSFGSSSLMRSISKSGGASACSPFGVCVGFVILAIRSALVATSTEFEVVVGLN